MRLAISGNLEKSGLRKTVGALVRQLDSLGMDYAVDRRIAELLAAVDEAIPPSHVRDSATWLAGTDILVALGGDGTILAAAREVGELAIPILGVNLGKLGFLAEVTPEDLSSAIRDLHAGNFRIEERLVIEATSPSAPGKTLFAVNDVVVDKARSSRVIDLETHIDGEYAVTYRGDGLIISTPTGSTAYALSNGGPIVTPASRVFGITPISPHTLSGRPLIIPETSHIKVIVHSSNDEVLVSADGQTQLPLPPPIELNVRKAGYTVRLVKRTDRTYFDVLRAKLHWGRNPRSR
ncbi:MAG: NAD(+)/NADH kinase [Bacteroidota bacterium]